MCNPPLSKTVISSVAQSNVTLMLPSEALIMVAHRAATVCSLLTVVVESVPSHGSQDLSGGSSSQH